jgi:5-methylcytosine-specific restriction endonuclease McrA
VGRQGKRRCRECAREKKRLWNRAHRPYRAKKARENYHRRQKRNPDYQALQSRKRRARERGANAGFKPWMLRYYRYAQQSRCWYCGKLMHRDLREYHLDKETLEHQLPLSRGGKHSWENTVLACRACNVSKGIKTSEEFACQ